MVLVTNRWFLALRLLNAHIQCSNHSLSVVSCSAAIVNYGQATRLELALLLLSEARLVRLSPDAASYRAAVTACARCARWVTALSLLCSAQFYRLRPDLATHNATITACEKGLRWEVALGVLEGMRFRFLAPDVVTYSALASACEKGAEWVRALGFYLEARTRHRLPLDLPLFGAAMSACEKGGEWARVFQLHSELRAAALRPDVSAYNATLSSCSRGVQWVRALIILDRMRAEFVRPDAASHRAAVDACEQGGASHGIGRILQESIRSYIPELVRSLSREDGVPVAQGRLNDFGLAVEAEELLREHNGVAEGGGAAFIEFGFRRLVRVPAVRALHRLRVRLPPCRRSDELIPSRLLNTTLERQFGLGSCGTGEALQDLAAAPDCATVGCSASSMVGAMAARRTLHRALFLARARQESELRQEEDGVAPLPLGVATPAPALRNTSPVAAALAAWVSHLLRPGSGSGLCGTLLSRGRVVGYGGRCLSSRLKSARLAHQQQKH